MEVAVIGSGLMGSGIAACISAGGPHHVHMFDTSSEALKAGVENAINQREFLRENHVPPTAVPGEIYAAESIESAVKNADFVFEAVLEDTGVKQSVFKQIENACRKEHFVMCTNTSSLSVTEIASKLDKPGRLLAAHFIGPAYLVPLVEVCPGRKTDGDAVEKVEKFLKSCGKKPAVVSIHSWYFHAIFSARYFFCRFFKICVVIFYGHNGNFSVLRIFRSVFSCFS